MFTNIFAMVHISEVKNFITAYFINQVGSCYEYVYPNLRNQSLLFKDYKRVVNKKVSTHY